MLDLTDSECTLCLKTDCCDAYSQCLGDTDCLCLGECLFEDGKNLLECQLLCDVLDPLSNLDFFLTCDLIDNCSQECPQLLP